MFAVAHELVHSREPLDRFLGGSLLCTAGYMHWSVSHHAHHAKVPYYPCHRPCHPLSQWYLPASKLWLMSGLHA